MNKTQTQYRNLFLKGGLRGRCPNSNFSKLPELSKTSQAKKLIFGLYVIIDMAAVADMALLGR